MDKHSISSLTLTAMARHGIAAVQMRILSNVERDRAARVETDSEVATVVELLDGAQLTVGYILFSVWGGELDAVAFTERSLCLSV